MARRNYGPQVKQRTKRLLEALLAYANHEVENSEQLPLQVHWKNEKHLLVKTKVRFLEELTALTSKDGKLSSDEIKEALHRLEDFVEILEDHRIKTQGADDWHFTLKLWYKQYDTAANLKRLDVEWEHRRSQKSQPITEDESFRTGLAKSAKQDTHLVLQDKTKANPSFPNVAMAPVQKPLRLQDWGEAPEVSSFYGRTEELCQLEQWILQDCCKVIALLGMGGIGKTTLAVMLAERIQEQFEFLVWRSLKIA